MKPPDFDPPLLFDPLLFPPALLDALLPVELPDFANGDGAEEEPLPHAAVPTTTITVAVPAAICRIRMGTNVAQRRGALHIDPFSAPAER
ncbi:MAG: hypothetical protein ACJ786_06995 [Catenulispora sp.]